MPELRNGAGVTVEAVLDDLDRLVDQALWAHAAGYGKAGRGLDAEHGTDLSKTEEQREKAETYDIEIGEYKARLAYQHAARAVGKADRLLAACAAADGVTFQPRVVRLTGYAPASQLRLAARWVRWRLSVIDAERHKHRLATIRGWFDRPIRDLAKALDYGPTQVFTAHRENPCRTCGIRERVAKKAECATCATWRQRHDGKTRPVELDLGPVRQARAAQARRAARGEGWGEA